MKKMSNSPLVLSDYYYTSVKDPETLLPFSYVDHLIPELNFLDVLVETVFSPTGALYFEIPEKVRNARFLYTKIWSDKKQDILFSTISHSKYKIWLNGEYIGACTNFDLFTFYLSLRSGENVFVFEVDLANPNYYDFNNRIVLQAEEERSPCSFLCGTCLEYEKWIQFFQKKDCRNSDCSCIFVPRCYRLIRSALVSVSDDFGNLLCSAVAQPGIPVTFLSEELKKKSPHTVLFHLILEVHFIDGSSTIREQKALARNYIEEKQILRLEWGAALETADEYTRSFLYNEYNSFFKTNNPPSLEEAVALFKLDTYLKQIEKQEKPCYLRENNSLIYYRSAFDLQYRKIRICKPLVLSSEHPGLIVFVNPLGNSIGAKVSHLLEEHSDLLLVDIAIAGFSTGTAISEALISEALMEIKKIYDYDAHRIYWYGYCNSGSAVWSYCQNHPDLAARIVVVESTPDPKRIQNIRHSQTISYIWDHNDEKYKKQLPQVMDKQLFLIQNSTHNYMQFYLYRAENFQDLEYRLPEYPKKICFTTERMRFNRSFWITVNSIRPKKIRTKVWGEILDSDKIRIRLHNCDDFSIDVPHDMQDVFTVEINGTSIPCKKAETLRFLREKGKYRLVHNTLQNRSRKGTGLLDVYYGALRILHDGSETATEVAQKFAEPETMSFSPKLQVKFPVYATENFPVEEGGRNLILINVDQVCGEDLALPVKLSKTGYCCCGRNYEGDYCVLQVAKNPLNPQGSILHVGSNQLEKFKNHLLLRKIVLPSMLTGISPYWNAAAICITEEKIDVMGEMTEDLI